jgi:LmbE family N-acetylglucosaminyl deacetylase
MGPMADSTRELLEQDLIPYVAGVFEATRAFVLAPHPDDEVFGCGAAIASLRERGCEVVVFVATDGGGFSTDAAERARIAAVRLAESASALGHLGGARIVEGGAPDRGVAAQAEPLAARLRALLECGRSSSPCAPCEIHPDHRGLTQAFLLAEAALPAEAQVAFYEVSQPIAPNFLLDATRFTAAKERAVAEFVSQNDGHDYPAFIRGLSAYRRMTLPRSVEAAEAFHVVAVERLRSGDFAALAARIGPSGRFRDPRDSN